MVLPKSIDDNAGRQWRFSTYQPVRQFLPTKLLFARRRSCAANPSHAVYRCDRLPPGHRVASMQPIGLGWLLKRSDPRLVNGAGELREFFVYLTHLLEQRQRRL